MVLTMTLAKSALPLLITAAVYGTHKLANENGLFALIDSAIAARQAPDVDYALQTHWTGIEGIDNLFSLLLTFFLPAVNGKHPTVTLQGAYFFGQLISLYTLMVVESFRVGNAWKAVSLYVVIILLMRNWWLIGAQHRPLGSRYGVDSYGNSVTGIMSHTSSHRSISSVSKIIIPGSEEDWALDPSH